MTSTRVAWFATLAVLCLARAAGAQPSTADIDRALHERWRVVLRETTTARGVDLQAAALSDADKRATYLAALRRLADDTALMKLAVPDLRLVDQVASAADRARAAELVKTAAKDAPAKSLSATSTNPAAGNLTEKSGFADLLALALNGQNFFNANATAVSLNLNALALFSLADPAVYSELHRYQQHDLLRRLGGTVVFGSKIPEKDITGISGLPNADTLLDAFSWDVKYRLLGDKDARAKKWYGDTLGRSALVNQMIVLQADVPIGDVGIFSAALSDLIGERLSALKARVNRSPQLTFKAAGTHLTQEAGKNKYTYGLLFDQGFAQDKAFTADVLYSITTDVRLGAGKAFQVKQLAVNLALSARLLPDVIVDKRSVEWSNGVTANVFTNRSALPLTVTNTWKLFSKFEIPVSSAATIPLSIVFTNDKNDLQKTKYVVGFVGVSYDFSTLASVLKQ